MRLGLLTVAAFWCLPVFPQSLQIMGSDEGFFPFYYGNNLNKGILVEVMNEFTVETGIAAEFRPMARNRQAWALKEGLANAVFANPLWMPLSGPNACCRSGVNLAVTVCSRNLADNRTPLMNLRAASVFADGLSTVIGSSGGLVPIWSGMMDTMPSR